MAGPTIVDVARHAGVSFKTVARVINGVPSVKARIRERVEAAIEQLGYRPNVWARSLRSARSHLIGLVFAYPKGPLGGGESDGAERGRVFATSYYMHQTHLAAMAVCQQQGYHLLLEEVRVSGLALERRARETIKATRLDGVLLVPPLSDDLRLLRLLQAEEVSFVRLAPTKHLNITPYVRMDDCRAAYEQTKLLCELGHRDIGFIKGPGEHGSSAARFRGFEAAMRDAGARVNREWCMQVDYSNAKLGLAAGAELLAKKSRPTAIFAFNDELALGVVSAALRCGLKVPEDVSVVGFDDSPLASMLWPGLTTVHQPILEMALRAGDMLIDLIEHRETALIEEFNFSVVQRDSTAPPKAFRTRARIGSRVVRRTR